MKVLITGGAGFMGSYTARALLKDGHTVRILDRHKSEETPADCEVQTGDVREREVCEAACRGVELVIHNAAMVVIPKTIRFPVRAGEINVTGTLNLLKASLSSGVRRFVFMSSSKIYGDTENYPSTEDDLLCPVTPYAMTKFIGEQHCHFFRKKHGLDTVSLRPFSVYGPGQHVDSGFIGNILEAVCEGREPVWCGTPDMSRDFVYVEDVVSVCLQAAFKKKLPYPVFNVGTGEASTLEELGEITGRIVKRQVKPCYSPTRPGTALRTCADMKRVQSVFDFKRSVDLETGLRKTVAWYKKKLAKKKGTR